MFAKPCAAKREGAILRDPAMEGAILGDPEMEGAIARCKSRAVSVQCRRFGSTPYEFVTVANAVVVVAAQVV